MPTTPDPRTLTGTLPDGTEVLVTIWPNPADGAELAFREGDGRFGRWGIPTRLTDNAMTERSSAEKDAFRKMLDDERGAKKIAADAADRFRDVLSECLGHPDENPGDDVLVAELREHFGKTGPEPTRWRDFCAGALAMVDQINADRTPQHDHRTNVDGRCGQVADHDPHWWGPSSAFWCDGRPRVIPPEGTDAP